jgi:hypothetical protein
MTSFVHFLYVVIVKRRILFTFKTDELYDEFYNVNEGHVQSSYNCLMLTAMKLNNMPIDSYALIDFVGILSQFRTQARAHNVSEEEAMLLKNHRFSTLIQVLIQ